MKQLLENLIKDWWSRPLPKILPREIDLTEYADLAVKKIISVVGFRRTGKTYTLFDLAKKLGQRNCVYINFEDERIPRETKGLTAFTDVLTELSGSKPYFLLLDEIQNIPDWSLWARRINENSEHKVFISGSSSKLSSAELPTELRGRSLTVLTQPLNFKEFLKFKNVKLDSLPKPQILHFTREYLLYGGFPEIVLVEAGKKPLVLDEYFQAFLLRDVIERHNLRNEPAVKLLIQLLLNASFFTISKLANNLRSLEIKTSKTSIMRYLQYLEQSFFLNSLTLHTPSLKNRFKAQKKPYFVDSYFLSRYSTAFSQNLGRIMENTIAIHLQKIIQTNLALAVYYWRDYQNHEVDFVIREKEQIKNLIQVSFVFSKKEISQREIRSLTKAASLFKISEALLITWDFEAEIKVDDLKISCLPLYKWLVLDKP